MTCLREHAVTSGAVRSTVAAGVLDARGVRYGDRLDPADRASELGPPRVSQAPPTAFPQAPGLLDALLGPALGELPQHEDSFSLRIQAPDDGDGLPVLLFVHGGGFTTGSGEARWYDAHDLVREGRLVLVTVSYRLGALATLAGEADPEGSGRPLRDLVQAARWVRDNIVAFGGDPGNVTIAGDSAGAWFARALSLLPATRGLFARTALVSVPRLLPLAADDHLARRMVFEAALAPSAIATAKAEAILAAQRATSAAYRGQGFAFAPAAGASLPGWTGDPAVAAARLHTGGLLLLTTAAESAAFLRPQPSSLFAGGWVEEFVGAEFRHPEAVLAHLVGSGAGAGGYEAAVAAMTLWQFTSVAYEMANAALVPTRLVRLDVESPLDRALSPHCFPLPFLFGDRAAWRDAPMLAGLGGQLFDRTRGALQAALVDFVCDGSGSAPVWDAAAPRVLSVTVAGSSVVTPGDVVVAEVAQP